MLRVLLKSGKQEYMYLFIIKLANLSMTFC